MPLILTALTVTGIFLLLVIFEAWTRKYKPHNEFSRKFIHITVGSFAAFWPFYLEWNWIILLSLAFIAVVLVSRYRNIFRAIHSVDRTTWGEIFFAISVGVLALVTHHPWVYAIAILHMSLADGLAAVAGVTWGKSNRYKVFGSPKSFVGSAVFLIISIALLTAYSFVARQNIQPEFIVGLAFLATAVENLGVYGLDNLLIPLLIGGALTLR